MADDPAGNRSAWFRPRITPEAVTWSAAPQMYVGKTYLELHAMTAGTGPESRAWVLDYAGDDALVAELTAKALARK